MLITKLFSFVVTRPVHLCHDIDVFLGILYYSCRDLSQSILLQRGARASSGLYCLYGWTRFLKVLLLSSYLPYRLLSYDNMNFFLLPILFVCYLFTTGYRKTHETHRYRNHLNRRSTFCFGCFTSFSHYSLNISTAIAVALRVSV